MSLTYLGFDLGATSWRAFLGREMGDEFEVKEIFREENLPVKKAEGLFWDIEKIFSGMKRVLKKVSEQGIKPAAIGIDSWSVDYGLIDKEGFLIEPPRCYRDPRNQGIKEKLSRKLGLDFKEIFFRTGVMCEEITTLCQLFAARETTPDILERASYLLFIPDFLRYRLCNEISTDFTLASTSQMYNLSERCWDQKLITLLQLPANIFPKIIYGSSVLSTLSNEIQKETGTGPIPVITGASHDTAAAFSTVESDEANAILISGTWSIMGVHTGRKVFFDSVDPERYGYEGNPDGTVRFLCNIPGMWILEQCRLVWEKQGISSSYGFLTTGARESTHFKSVIDPYHPGFRYPEDMTAAIKNFCIETAQAVPGTPAEFTRAIMMGLAFTYAKAVRELEKITKRKIKRLIIIGGGSRNPFLNQLIAEKTGVEVIRGWVEATTIGNLLNQRRALQNYAH